MKENVKEFLFIFILSFIPRILFLFFSMPSITHDEADYFLNGYMLAKTGGDFWGNKLFLTSGLLSATSAIPIYINAINYLFFPKTIFFSRLFFTIINIFTPIFFYYLIKKITKNKEFSFISFLVFNFSPWFLYLSSQINFESILSGFFYILSFFILIKNFKNKIIKIFLFLITSFLSFNSYMGIKTSFLFLLTISFLVFYLNKNNLNFKNILTLSFYSFLIYVSLIIILLILPNNNLFLKRSNSDLIILNKSYVENKVWFERLTSENFNILKKIFHNKITVILNHFLNNFFYTINPSIIFLKGDPHPIYGNNIFGLFYLWQIIFFIYGLIEIKKIPNLKIIWPLFLIIIFGSIPTTISIFEPTIALRSFPIIIPYSLIITNGIFQLINKTKKFKKIRLLIFFIFLISFIHFFIIYQSRIKILSSEQWHLGEKKLFEKVLKENPNKKIYIVNNEPKETFMLFSFYHLDDAYLIKNKLKNNDYKYKNIIFTDKKISLIKNGSILIKRGTQNIEEIAEKKLLPVNPYLEAGDKSGVLYYKINN